jgi:hypothetical protein
VWATTVNPETKLLLLQHGFEVLRAGRVQLKTDVRNQRSQQAIARLGAHYEGTLRRHFRRSDGTVRDSVLFSITAEDWPACRRMVGKVTPRTSRAIGAPGYLQATRLPVIPPVLQPIGRRGGRRRAGIEHDFPENALVRVITHNKKTRNDSMRVDLHDTCCAR